MSKKYIICIIIMLLVIGLGVLGYFLWERYACITKPHNCECILIDFDKGPDCSGCPEPKVECSFQIFKENLFSTNK